MARDKWSAKARLDALTLCNCGHQHNQHENTSRNVLANGPCIWMGCRCKAYAEAPLPEREKRPRPIKTLDRDEPKLFEVNR